ncbi:MAG: OmpA family protein [Robiginitomaculum sp.]|nr:OmpA family protein [Robiginitomaculum sp.]
MSVGMKLLIGLLAFLGLGAMGIHYEVLSQLSGAKSAKVIAQTLQANAKQTLLAADHDDVFVFLDGQRAIVVGDASSQQQFEAIKQGVLSSTGSGGLITGGITVVDMSGLQVAEPVVNPNWAATLSSDGVVAISGYVDNKADQRLIRDQANKLFAGKFNDELKVSSGAFAGAVPQMIIVLQSLTQLDTALVVLEDQNFALTGTAADKQKAKSVSGVINNIGGDFTGLAQITWPAPKPNEFGIAVDAGEIETSAKCQQLFAEALVKNKILFEFNSAKIGEESHGFLDFLVQLSLQCSAFSLNVGGHTDNTGADEYNVHLSNLRANSVVDYLLSKGGNPQQFTASGFGPNQPVCTQNTLQCRAQNRRIEIIVED